MVLPMDNLKRPPVPADAPLAMPVQDLGKKPQALPVARSMHTYLARLLAFGGAALIGSIGTWQMYRAFGNTDFSFLQWILLFLFSLTFYWVSFSATAALAGLLSQPPVAEGLNPEGGKIAILMPVYGEDPAMTGAALFTMGEELADSPIASRCEIFILSDTQKTDAWLAETAAFNQLRQRCRLPVWYRRRRKNIGSKAGNIAQFVRRWGARYEYLLMLDADSLMSGDSIQTMVARMDAEPRLGLLQTAPRLIGGESLLARTIQFAGALYGKVVARGVNAWQGNDGNYWGHNAIIRCRAFAQSCGLPELRGRRPIGGHIMSHDFVEAALLRRAGWQVRMDPDISGSFEGLPPTLGDLAGRERRWAQGNLQHLGVLPTKGLSFANRAHFVIGILSYLMSPIWMLMMSVGMLITTQALFTQPQYFPLAYQLFPNWPTFDSRLMRLLFFSALVLLLLPKVIGWLMVLCNPRQRRLFGGAWAVSKGFFLELLVSTLYAPMMMLIQTHHVIDIFLGRDSGWATQSRSGDVIPWSAALRQTWLYLLIGILPLIALTYFSPMQLLWLSPVLLGLLLSPCLARHSGNVALGQYLASRYYLLIPEEIDPSREMRKVMLFQNQFGEARKVNLRSLLQNSSLLEAHIAALDSEDSLKLDEEDFLLAITVKAKLEAAQHLDELLRYLNDKEKLFLAGDAALLQQSHQHFANRA